MPISFSAPENPSDGHGLRYGGGLPWRFIATIATTKAAMTNDTFVRQECGQSGPNLMHICSFVWSRLVETPGTGLRDASLFCGGLRDGVGRVDVFDDRGSRWRRFGVGFANEGDHTILFSLAGWAVFSRIGRWRRLEIFFRRGCYLGGTYQTYEAPRLGLLLYITSRII